MCKSINCTAPWLRNPLSRSTALMSIAILCRASAGPATIFATREIASNTCFRSRSRNMIPEHEAKFKGRRWSHASNTVRPSNIPTILYWSAPQLQPEQPTCSTSPVGAKQRARVEIPPKSVRRGDARGPAGGHPRRVEFGCRRLAGDRPVVEVQELRNQGCIVHPLVELFSTTSSWSGAARGFTGG